MNIIFDLDKDAKNIDKHGVSLELATHLEWDSALTWPDARRAYGEPRECALVLLEARVYFVAFLDRADSRRIISLRKANPREVNRYVFEN